MRTCSVVLLMIVVCLGCNRREEARRKAVQDNLKQIGEEMQNYHETHESSGSEFSHVIAAETEYYTTGPQQGRPPDGKYPAGTNVSIVEDAGSYVLVRSERGVEAYVAADAVGEPDLGEGHLGLRCRADHRHRDDQGRASPSLAEHVPPP